MSEALVNKAKLAEQAERYEDMAKVLGKNVLIKFKHINEER